MRGTWELHVTEPKTRQALTGKFYQDPRALIKSLYSCFSRNPGRHWGIGMATGNSELLGGPWWHQLHYPSLSPPSLSPFFLYLHSPLLFLVLPGGSVQKGPSKAGESYNQPHLTSPSSSLLPFLPSSFLPFFLHSTIQGLTLQWSRKISLPPSQGTHLLFILGGPSGEDPSSSECYRQVLSEDCTWASLQSRVKAPPRKLPWECPGVHWGHLAPSNSQVQGNHLHPLPSLHASSAQLHSLNPLRAEDTFFLREHDCTPIPNFLQASLWIYTLH